MNQLKNHIHFGIKNRLRNIYHRNRIGYLGKNVFFESNVKLLRYPKNIFIDDFVIIKEGTKICSCNANAIIKIGDRTTIGYHSIIFASENIQIGYDCLIAPNVYIVDSNHRFEKGQNINQQANETAPIIIGNDVWIGNGTTILKNVTIGNGCVIAANSVVNNPIPPYEIWGGSPAKKIGERK